MSHEMGSSNFADCVGAEATMPCGSNIEILGEQKRENPWQEVRNHLEWQIDMSL